MGVTIPQNFESEFYSRSYLFAKYAVGSGKDQNYQSIMANAQIAIAGLREILAIPNGQYMVTMATNLLARFCKRLALIIPDDIPSLIHPPLAYSENLLGCLAGMTQEINPLIELEIVSTDRKGLYDAALVVGQYKGELGKTVYINSDGWLAYIDTDGNHFSWIGDNPNPIGAYTAASLGVAEIFKTIMSKLSMRNRFATTPSGSYVFSTLDYGFRNNKLGGIKLSKTAQIGSLHMISMGAINSAVLYTLSSIPEIQVKASVVEPQICDISNLNRYLLLTAEEAIQGVSKCSIAQKIAKHLLEIEVYPESYEDYRRRLQSPIDTALIGVDNDETRWHIQEDLPGFLLCGGTELYQVRISRHVYPFEEACLGCIYTKRNLATFTAQTEPVPSISFVSALAGILMAGELLKADSKELRPYTLDICLDLDILRMPHFMITKPQKSEKCGCNCQKWGLPRPYIQ